MTVDVRWTGIFGAAAEGNRAALETAVRADPLVLAARSPDGFTPLHLACFFGRTAAAVWLVKEGAPVNEAADNETRVAPLHSAVAGADAAARLTIARALLDHGADPNARQQKGFTALHAAALHGDEALVRLLLERGAEPALATDDGRTAADLARETGHPAVATMV